MTKKESAILADVRNKFTPILTFFELWDKILNDTTLSQEQKGDLYKLICREEHVSVEAVRKVADLLKSFG